MYLKHDRRLTESLVLYWQGLRHERQYPTREDIKIDEIPDLWPDCYLLVIDAETKQIRFEAVGENIQKLAISPDFEHQELGKRITQLAMSVVPHTKVTLDEQEFPFGEERILKYRAILLPLGEDGHITHLLGGVRYKRFPVTDEPRMVEPDPYEGLMEELSKRPRTEAPRLPSQAYSTQQHNPMVQAPQTPQPTVNKQGAVGVPTENPLFMSPAEYQAHLEKEKDKP